ncbi:MAG: hypothetical protein MRY32_03830 [Rickettsiales bacterium]|nr:hypothetical protein [Rickettsiales bacterium]
MIRSLLLILGLALALSACTSSRVEVLKSPCVGVEGSPCGPKRPVNDWWMDASEKV